MTDDPKSESAEKPAKKPTSRLRKVLVRGAIGLVATPVALLGFLHTPPGEGLLRARVEQRLGERVSTEAKVEGLHFSLLHGLTLEHVRILGNDRRQAIAIDEIHVAPAWKKTLGGALTLESLKVRGVHVDVRGREDGTTNLTGVFLERKSVAHLGLDELEVSDVALTLEKPDGTRVAVKGAKLSGSVLAKPAEKTVSTELTLRVDSLDYRKPGTSVHADALSTSVHVDLVSGKGDLSIGPTAASVQLTRDDKPAFPLALALPAVKVHLAPGELGLAAETLKLAAVSLAVAKVSLRRAPDGSLVGEQKGEIATLTVEADAANALAGKKILAGDLALDAHVHGSPEALAVDLALRTPGGHLGLTGTLNSPAKSYDLVLVSSALDVRKIVALDTVPELSLGDLSIKAKGSGTDKEQAEVAFSVHLGPSRVKGVDLQSADVDGSYAKGVLTLAKTRFVALGQDLHLTGTYELGTKRLDAELGTRGSLAVTLASLKAAGLAAPSSPLLASVSTPRPLTVRVRGNLDKALAVELVDVSLGALGGSARASGRVDLLAGDPSKGEKRFRADTVDTTVTLEGVSLDALGRARGKALPVTGTVAGKVHVTGSATAPNADFSLGARLGEGRLAIAGTSQEGRIEANVALSGRNGEELLRTRANGRLAGRALDPNAPLSLTVDLPSRKLSDFAPLLSPEVSAELPEGRAELHAEVHGTLGRPVADVRVKAEGAFVKALGPARQHAEITVHAEPSAGTKGHGWGTHVDARAEIHTLEGVPPVSLVASADLEGPLSSARTAKLRWTADLTLPETDLASLAKLPLPAEKRASLEGLGGHAKVALHAKGTREDVELDLDVGVHGLSRGSLRGVDVALAAHLDETRTRADLHALLGGSPLVTVHGEAAQGGRGLLVKKLEGADPEIDVKLDLPRFPLGPFVSALPASATVEGRAALTGHASSPRLDAAFDLGGLERLDGKPAEAKVTVAGTLDDARVSANLGALTLTAKVSPKAYLAAKKSAGEVPVALSLTAPKTPVGEVLPNLESLRPLRVQGTLSSDLAADVVLFVEGEKRELRAIDTRGSLALDGARFAVPGSSRALDGVRLALRGQGSALSLERLEAHEHDREKSDRTLVATGAIDLSTRKAHLALDTKDVLVFGGNFGQADAPRASLTGKIGILADLSRPVKRVDVNVEALELRAPDRFARAHEQEALSLGDVVDLGTGAEVGKLRRTSSAPTKVATNESTPSEPAEKTLELVVHVPHTVHLMQKPLDLYAKGKITLVRTTAGRTLSGALVCERGSLMVGGVEHTLHHGEVRLTDEGAMLDLTFEHEPHPAALRDFTTSDGQKLYAHMVGPLGKQKLFFSGVADGLFEALAVNGGGRTRVLSSPDAPASQTAQLPQTRELRLTAYMAANLPHLAFLNRMNTLADPSTGRFAYGRFQTLEAERYSEDGKRRLRVTSRAPVIGQSDGEVEFDLVFQNDPQVVSGVGILGGTRAGGGPAVFWEWSSKK
jgi:hypothetical protein